MTMDRFAELVKVFGAGEDAAEKAYKAIQEGEQISIESGKNDILILAILSRSAQSIMCSCVIFGIFGWGHIEGELEKAATWVKEVLGGDAQWICCQF